VNNRHRKTLAAIFAEAPPVSLDWAAIEALFVAAGCDVVEGSGSRVRFVHVHGGVVASFHRPHPGKEAKRYQIRDAREFLTRIGVAP
jgi:hypothetical protein